VIAVKPRATVGVSEAAFLEQVRCVARDFGWAVYHPYLSIRSQRGWPDLALCRPPRLILAELKSQTGAVRETQQRWLDMLRDCPGVEVHLWRPADLQRIAELLR
jgi:hypothetical protein